MSLTTSPLLLLVLLCPLEAIADVSDDQDAYKRITMCYMNVYRVKPYSNFVLQRDFDDLARAEKKLHAHVKKEYSPKDREQLALNGDYAGMSTHPKKEMAPDEVVRICRKMIKMIEQNY